jgi:hypothetical protein
MLSESRENPIRICPYIYGVAHCQGIGCGTLHSSGYMVSSNSLKNPEKINVPKRWWRVENDPFKGIEFVCEAGANMLDFGGA